MNLARARRWAVLMLGIVLVVAALVTDDMDKLLIGAAFLGVAPMTGT